MDEGFIDFGAVAKIAKATMRKNSMTKVRKDKKVYSKEKKEWETVVSEEYEFVAVPGENLLETATNAASQALAQVIGDVFNDITIAMPQDLTGIDGSNRALATRDVGKFRLMPKAGSRFRKGRPSLE